MLCRSSISGRHLHESRRAVLDEASTAWSLWRPPIQRLNVARVVTLSRRTWS
jgi:hypothetical protein